MHLLVHENIVHILFPRTISWAGSPSQRLPTDAVGRWVGDSVRSRVSKGRCAPRMIAFAGAKDRSMSTTACCNVFASFTCCSLFHLLGVYINATTCEDPLDALN